MSIVIQHWARFRFFLPEAGCILALDTLTACVRVCRCMCSQAACMQGAEQDVRQPLSPSAGCLETQSLTDQQALVMLLSLPHNGGVTATHNYGQYFKWLLGIWTQVSMLEEQVLLPTELSSQPWCLSSWPISYGAGMELCNWMQGSQKTVNSKDRLLCVLWPEVKSNSNANEYRCLAALTVEHAATAAMVLNICTLHCVYCCTVQTDGHFWRHLGSDSTDALQTAVGIWTFLFL